MAISSKPHVLISSTPIYGHLMPIRVIGKELIARGYDVTFVTGSKYRDIIEDIGATFVPLSGYGDYTEAELETRWPERNLLPPGPPQLLFDMEHVFVKSIPSQYEAQQLALKGLAEKYPGEPVVLVSESVFLGSTVGLAGAPGFQPTATLSIGIVPLFLSSIDTASFGPGLPPDSSPEGRERNKAINEGTRALFGKVQGIYEEVLKSFGANRPELPLFLDAAILFPDRYLQMCIPSVEYPRSDAPSSIRFAGGLPKGSRDPFIISEDWWGEVINNKSKKVIAVSQGSIAVDFSDLVIPTLTALKDREDVLVVIALGKKGASLPEGTLVPANARVADFIPFDDLLPHSSIFITNGGYGGFQHAVSNGTPVIIAGATEDKAEVAGRAEWSGVGVNLRTGRPTPEAILNAVDEVLSNPKYKKRALELEAEMATFDPMSIVAQTIDELAASKSD